MILLINANANKIPLPDGSVQCVVTSPPYWGLRDYGLPPLVWGGVAGCEHVWGRERRISNSPPRDHDGPHAFADSRGLENHRRGTTLNASQGQFCQLCGAWRGSLGLEPTPELYVEHLVQVFREVRRVLRSDGVLWLNLGDSYATRHFADARGASYPRNVTQGDKCFIGTSLESRKSHIGKTVVQQSVGSLPLKSKDLVGIPWRVAFALQADGWWLRSDVIWSKPNCMPESVKDRPTKAHEYLFLLSKSQKYYYDADAIREELAESTLADSRNATGRHTQGKTYSKYFNGASPDETSPDKPSWYRAKVFVNPVAGRNKRTVWEIPTAPYSGAHFATFPPALVEPCIKAGTSKRGCCPVCGAPWERVVEKTFIPQEDVSAAKGVRGHEGTKQQPNDGWDGLPRGSNRVETTGWKATCSHDAEPIPCVVLDPFVGSGTTLLVARALGRHSIGLDLSLPYLTEQVIPRLELDKLEAWGNGRQEEPTWHELPLFRKVSQ
jgi:DNA modification methylase